MRYNEDGSIKNSQHRVAELLGVTRAQVCHACDRIRRGSKVKEKYGHEERKPRVHKDEGTYIITSRNHSCRISEDNLRYLKKLYCLEGLTINEVCRTMRIPRRDFYLIKTAFSITKDDAPFTDEDMINLDTEELVADSLQEKKRLYFVRLDQKEIQDMRKRLMQLEKREHFIEKIHSLITDDMAEFAKKYKGPIIKHQTKKGKYLLEPVVFDLHLGKLSWAPETGENYDYRIARDRFNFVVDDVYSRAMEVDIERTVIPIACDFWHIDNKKGQTNAGTLMDYDSRSTKLFLVGVQMLIQMIDKFSQIGPVTVVLVAGNHDEEISFYALQYLAAWYRNSEIVNVWSNIRARKYIEFGVNLIGYDHGHRGQKRLPANMSVEASEAWGRTFVREWHTGHKHRLSVIEEKGVTVRELSTVTGTDAWHHNEGYSGALCRSQSFLWDRENSLEAVWHSNILIKNKYDGNVMTI